MMKTINILASACKYCRHYKPEGRRGGVCQQLSAPVQGSWKACSFALPPFAPTWENLEDVWSLAPATPVLASSNSLASGLDKIAVSCVEETICTSQQAKVQPVLV